MEPSQFSAPTGEFSPQTWVNSFLAGHPSPTDAGASVSSNFEIALSSGIVRLQLLAQEYSDRVDAHIARITSALPRIKRDMKNLSGEVGVTTKLLNEILADERSSDGSSSLFSKDLDELHALEAVKHRITSVLHTLQQASAWDRLARDTDSYLESARGSISGLLPLAGHIRSLESACATLASLPDSETRKEVLGTTQTTFESIATSHLRSLLLRTSLPSSPPPDEHDLDVIIEAFQDIKAIGGTRIDPLTPLLHVGCTLGSSLAQPFLHAWAGRDGESPMVMEGGMDPLQRVLGIDRDGIDGLVKLYHSWTRDTDVHPLVAAFGLFDATDAREGHGKQVEDSSALRFLSKWFKSLSITIKSIGTHPFFGPPAASPATLRQIVLISFLTLVSGRPSAPPHTHDTPPLVTSVVHYLTEQGWMKTKGVSSTVVTLPLPTAGGWRSFLDTAVTVGGVTGQASTPSSLVSTLHQYGNERRGASIGVSIWDLDTTRTARSNPLNMVENMSSTAKKAWAEISLTSCIPDAYTSFVEGAFTDHFASYSSRLQDLALDSLQHLLPAPFKGLSSSSSTLVTSPPLPDWSVLVGGLKGRKVPIRGVIEALPRVSPGPYIPFFPGRGLLSLPRTPLTPSSSSPGLSCAMEVGAAGWAGMALTDSLAACLDRLGGKEAGAGACRHAVNELIPLLLRHLLDGVTTIHHEVVVPALGGEGKGKVGMAVSEFTTIYLFPILSILALFRVWSASQDTEEVTSPSSSTSTALSAYVVRVLLDGLSAPLVAQLLKIGPSGSVLKPSPSVAATGSAGGGGKVPPPVTGWWCRTGKPLKERSADVSDDGYTADGHHIGTGDGGNGSFTPPPSDAYPDPGTVSGVDVDGYSLPPSPQIAGFGDLFMALPHGLEPNKHFLVQLGANGGGSGGVLLSSPPSSAPAPSLASSPPSKTHASSLCFLPASLLPLQSLVSAHKALLSSSLPLLGEGDIIHSLARAMNNTPTAASLAGSDASWGIWSGYWSKSDASSSTSPSLMEEAALEASMWLQGIAKVIVATLLSIYLGGGSSSSGEPPFAIPLIDRGGAQQIRADIGFLLPVFGALGITPSIVYPLIVLADLVTAPGSTIAAAARMGGGGTPEGGVIAAIALGVANLRQIKL